MKSINVNEYIALSDLLEILPKNVILVNGVFENPKTGRCGVIANTLNNNEKYAHLLDEEIISIRPIKYTDKKLALQIEFGF